MAEQAPRRRTTSRRHPLLQERPSGQWYPDLVGKVRGYPTTYETWKKKSDQCREQIIRLNASDNPPTRKGVPDGWAGMKREAEIARITAGPEAKEIVTMLIKEGYADQPDDPRVELAFGAAVEIIIARDVDSEKPLYDARERLSAARLLADFLKAKPASKQDIKIQKAEDFLSILAGQSNLG